MKLHSKTTFFLIRHGQTPSNLKGIKQGIHIDDYLDAQGVMQVNNAGAMVQHLALDLFITSHLHRAEETAAILNKELQEPIQVFHDYRLRERDFGTLTGKTEAEINQVIPGWKEKDLLQAYDYRPYGGESVDDVRFRAFTGLIDAALNFSNHNIGIITHAGIIRLLLFHFPEIPRIYQGSKESKLKISNTDVYEWEISENKIQTLKSLIQSQL